MPAIYAHRMFGERVVSGLSRARFFEIFQYPEAYALGLHGPDLLFYYRPLYGNDVRRRGEAMHAQSAAPFFTRARHIVRKSDNAAADRAYLYGFACHFCLDSACQPVVDALMRRCSLTHAAVETAFDRTLLLDDGIDPVRADLTGHLRATPAAACSSALAWLTMWKPCAWRKNSLTWAARFTLRPIPLASSVRWACPWKKWLCRGRTMPA